MKRTVRITAMLIAVLLFAALAFSFALQISSATAHADDGAAGEAVTNVAEDHSLEIELEKTKQTKGWVAGIVIVVAAVAGAVCMGLAIIKAIDGIARQPEAEGKIRTTMMLGLVFVETAIIYALIVAILIVFVL